MDFDDIADWFSGDVNWVALGFALLVELSLVSAFFFNVFKQEAMAAIPLEYRLIALVLAPIVIYFVVEYKMNN